MQGGISSPLVDGMKNSPAHDCSLCPRLRRFLLQNRENSPDWHNAPVNTWYPVEGANSVKLLIVGLAPALRGANRTGIPFTGDDSGALLFEALKRHGFATAVDHSEFPDQHQLIGTAITNAVRCVPPANRPLAAEINTCRSYLIETMNHLGALKLIITLGKIAHESTIRALGGKLKDHPFAHSAETEIKDLRVFSSYHCSRYNINTGRLTADMFDAVFEEAARSLQT